MKRITLIIMVAITSHSFAQRNMEIAQDYKLELEEDGIVVEVFDSTNIDDSRYNKNNVIFREGVSFHYKFEHIDKNNEQRYIEYIDSLAHWNFIPVRDFNKNTIKQVNITVEKGLQGFGKRFPDYNQTIIAYTYPTQGDYVGSIRSSSGVIENEGNIWMHPPRDNYFEILELNPFPYIKAPYQIGTKWTWSLKIGDYWADGRWKLWKGTIQNEYQYEIVDYKTLNVKLGPLDCYVIEAIATSSIGETQLRAYFNETYGFVRLEYINIDGSKTNLELINFLGS
ncbi:hypothetical protein [Sediminicola sp. 1XM1-17]|uniref:hypothetical protein n=1 Tax=Sediminicola sp. 1XM1-17 TaxID=3127702 RepID=UPI00307868F2